MYCIYPCIMLTFFPEIDLQIYDAYYTRIPLFGQENKRRQKLCSISLIWRAQIGGLGRRKSLLVYDSFEDHVTDTVKASFKRENIELAVIPGGLTSLLQPLDVSLNKAFKDGVRKQWMQWMADGIHEFTTTG